MADFVPMAEAIAASELKTYVSGLILSLFSHIIRSRCYVDELEQHAQPESTGNTKNKDSTNALQTAFGHLSRLMETNEGQEQADAHETAPAPGEPTNAAAPADESTVEDTEDSDYAPPGTRPAVPSVIFDKDKSEHEHEFFMAVLGFLVELKATREAISDVWQKYPELDESTVPSLVTNCAVELVSLQETEFERPTPRPNEYPQSEYPAEKLPALLFCRMSGMFADKETPDSVMSPTTKDTLLSD